MPQSFHVKGMTPHHLRIIAEKRVQLLSADTRHGHAFEHRILPDFITARAAVVQPHVDDLFLRVDPKRFGTNKRACFAATRTMSNQPRWRRWRHQPTLANSHSSTPCGKHCAATRSMAESCAKRSKGGQKVPGTFAPGGALVPGTFAPLPDLSSPRLLHHVRQWRTKPSGE